MTIIKLCAADFSVHYTTSLSPTLDTFFATSKLSLTQHSLLPRDYYVIHILQSKAGTSTEAKNYIIFYDYPQRQYQVANGLQWWLHKKYFHLLRGICCFYSNCEQPKYELETQASKERIIFISLQSKLGNGKYF